MKRREFFKVLGATLGAGLLGGIDFGRRLLEKPLAVVRETKPLLGTVMTITVCHPDVVTAQQSIASAFSAVQKVDRVMSIHRSDSDVSRVNRASGTESLTVDSWLVAVLKEAQRFYSLTGGLYDVTCLPLMNLYGFYANGSLPPYPSDREIHETLDRIGTRYLSVDERGQTVGLTKRGAGIDLGSIGKGFAVDQAGDILKTSGIQNALIDLGGNILALGSPEGSEDPKQGWEVAIRNPFGGVQNPYFEILTLRDQAVATSGNYEQPRSHLLNPKRGVPSESGLLSATAVAANAMLADALSTSAFLLGPRSQGRFQKIANAIYYHGYSG